MKTIAVHSHKGGVGKTTVALLIAKYAAARGKTVCVIDFDFIGSGMGDLLPIEKSPDLYLDHFFLDAEPSGFDVKRLLGRYSDTDLTDHGFSIILNFKIKPGDSDDYLRLRNNMMGLMANEPHYLEIQTKTKILMDKLHSQGVDLVIFDCHPGLGFISDTARSMVHKNVYVSTPNRSDCFSLLKEMNLRKEMDTSSAFLIINMADPPLETLDSFRLLMEKDGLIGNEAKTLFPQLKYIGRKETQFAVIPDNSSFRKRFYIGSIAYLPKIDPNDPNFIFCHQLFSFIEA